MKKLLLLFLLCGFNEAKTQTNTFPASGNVGIGTTSPGEKLVVNGNVSLIDGGSFQIGSSNSVVWANSKILTRGYSNQDFTELLVPGHIANTASIRLLANGNVGIGAATPQYKLDVSGEARLLTTIVSSSNSPFQTSSVLYSQPGYNNIFGVDGTWTSKYFGMKTNGSFVVMGGNVGIGVTDPLDKLSVKGRIRAQEIKVESTNWPDYVFTKDYKLPTLVETETHIKEKGHLPGIPSAKEVRENGVELGEMNRKLLQKIEELTLHLIAQNKLIQRQNERLNGQEEEINKLNKLLKTEEK